MAADNPQRGEIWMHHASTGEYVVIGRATNKDPDGDIDGLVVYRALGHGAYYVRRIANFVARFTYQRGPFPLVQIEAE